MSLLQTVSTMAEATPAERNRAVDFLRAAAILVVVYGHWLMAPVVITDGEVHVGNLLSLATWTQPLTWLLQVMPIFFLVGGYANALSWRSARASGQAYGGWLRARLRRLTLPVLPLMVFWAALAPLGAVAGLDAQMLQVASRAALVPTWFLATYVVVVALAPAALVLWERVGWWSILGGFALAGLIDGVSLNHGPAWLAFANYVIVWGTVHQLGYAWQDGRLAGSGRRLLLVGIGLVGLYVLVVQGPYAVSMVGAASGEISNSAPARVTLGFLALFQAGLVLLLEPVLRRALQNPRLWALTILLNARIMSIYLWHLTVLVVLVSLSLALDGVGMTAAPNSPEWWLQRPLVFLVLTGLTVAAVAVVGRFEMPAADPRPEPGPLLPLLAVVGTCSALGVMAATGIADGDADVVRWWLPLLPVAASYLFGVSRWPASRSGTSS